MPVLKAKIDGAWVTVGGAGPGVAAGGATNAILSKASAADYDTAWTGAPVLTGLSVTGDTTLTGNATITGTLTSKHAVRAAGVIQASGANLHSFGITSFAKSGTGVYDLTLSAATSAPVATATLFNGYIGNATVDFTSATVLRVRTFNTSGAPADQAFAVIVVSQ